MEYIRKENNKKCIVYVDGASSGNPGYAGIGIVIRYDSKEIKISECIGIKTNNQAEYSALIRALKEIKNLKIREVIIKSDSKLIVSQIKGEYKVKSDKIRILYNKAIEMIKELNIEILWVKREENKEADDLAKRGVEKCLQKNMLQKK